MLWKIKVINNAVVIGFTLFAPHSSRNSYRTSLHQPTSVHPPLPCNIHYVQRVHLMTYCNDSLIHFDLNFFINSIHVSPLPCMLPKSL